MLNVTLVNPNTVYPTEQIDLDYKNKLLEIIKSSNMWKHPIVIHKEYQFVMDGHHRLKVAKALQLHSIPAVMMDYSNVGLESWRDDWDVTEELIISKFHKGELFPIKTTKHIFSEPLPLCNYSLDELGLGSY